MNKRVNTLSYMCRNKLIGVVRGADAAQMRAQAELYLESGLEMMEISMAVPGGLELLADLKQAHGERCVLGAGTVIDPVTAGLALRAGADFVAAPSFDEEVARICNLYCTVYSPGCLSSTEISQALRAGADIVKLFPPTPFTPQVVRSLCGMYPGLLVMMAGGVTESNLQEWLDAGVFVVSRPFWGDSPQAAARDIQRYMSTQAALTA